jgi:hypothetical protein
MGKINVVFINDIQTYNFLVKELKAGRRRGRYL